MAKKIAYVRLQQFLQDILEGKFNDTREVKEYYSKNIYDKYDRKIRSLNTEASKKMTDVYQQVRKIFIIPSYDETDEQPEIIDMPEEAEESAEQEGEGVKILTPQQMLSRLPISLAQLKAGNNSQKLKNKINVFNVYIKKAK